MDKNAEQLNQAICQLEKDAARLRLYLAGRLQKRAAVDTPQLRCLAQAALQSADELDKRLTERGNLP